MTVTAPAFLDETADLAAPRLLGWRLRSLIGDTPTEIGLTEVEAYRSDDPASHSFGGPRGRNLVMFDRPGLLYVYRSYGIHWCANVVCSPKGEGSAILLRAGAPCEGEAVMVARRGRRNPLAIGPGNLCQALGVTSEHNQIDLFDPTSPLRLLPGPPPHQVLATPRIGISKAVDVPWRFVAQEG